MLKKIAAVFILLVLLCLSAVQVAFAEAGQDHLSDETSLSSIVEDKLHAADFMTTDRMPSQVVNEELGSTKWYVSKFGSNSNGTSWESAWSELDQIDWSLLKPGDQIILDGGALNASMVYTSTLEPAASGSQELPLIIRLSEEEGRNGQAVFFGGNSVLLPECGQLNWDESEYVDAGDYGIVLKNGVSNIIIDGTKRDGIAIHGWRLGGVTFDPDRIDNQVDDNTANITLRFMEIYNNGQIEMKQDLPPGVTEDPIAPDLYFPYHGSPGIKLSGSGHRFEFLEVHDNAADAIQSNFTNPAGSVFNNIDDIVVSHSWFYNQRPHSGNDNGPAGDVCSLDDVTGCDENGAPAKSKEFYQYPSQPNGRREAFNWCTHNDGIQLYSSNDLNHLTLEKSIFGPNLMNALILGNRGDSVNSTAWVNDLKVKDVIITRFTNNALGMNNEAPNIGSYWQVERATIYGHFNKQNMGSLSIQATGPFQNQHFIRDSINIFGRSEFEDGNISLENNCEFNMYTGSIDGLNEDPQFKFIQEGDYFENNLSVDFATVFIDDYSVQNENCSSAGSQLTSVNQLMAMFEASRTDLSYTETVVVVPESDEEDESTSVQSDEPTPIPPGNSEDSNNEAQEIASTNDVDDNAEPTNATAPVANESTNSAIEGLLSRYGLTIEEGLLFIILTAVLVVLSILLIILVYYAWRLLVHDQREVD